jgi:hypothetical protein
MITHPQSRSLRESLLIAVVMVGMMIVGAVFLYFAVGSGERAWSAL